MLGLLRQSDRATFTSFELNDDTRFAREALTRPNTKVVASHRSTLTWPGAERENARVFDTYRTGRVVEASARMATFQHSKTATFWRGSEGTWLVGTANITATGVAAKGSDAHYRQNPRFRNAPDATQYNAYLQAQIQPPSGIWKPSRRRLSTESPQPLVVSSSCRPPRIVPLPRRSRHSSTIQHLALCALPRRPSQIRWFSRQS